MSDSARPLTPEATVPITTRKQLRAMYAAASGKSKTGIPVAVAKKFIKETPKRKLKSLGKKRRAKR